MSPLSPEVQFLLMPASTGVGAGIPDPVARLVADAMGDIKTMADATEPSHAVFLEAIRNPRAGEDTGLVMQKIDLVAAETNARLHKAPALNETDALGTTPPAAMVKHPPDSSYNTYEAARARMPLCDVWWRALRADEIAWESGQPKLAGGALTPPFRGEQSVADAVRFGSRSSFQSAHVHLTSEQLVGLHYALAGKSARYLAAVSGPAVRQAVGDEHVWDLRPAAGRRRAGLEPGSNENTYAARSREILVCGSIPETCVIGIYDTSVMAAGERAYASPDHEALLAYLHASALRVFNEWVYALPPVVQRKPVALRSLVGWRRV